MAEVSSWRIESTSGRNREVCSPWRMCGVQRRSKCAQVRSANAQSNHLSTFFFTKLKFSNLVQYLENSETTIFGVSPPPKRHTFLHSSFFNLAFETANTVKHCHHFSLEKYKRRQIVRSILDSNPLINSFSTSTSLLESQLSYPNHEDLLYRPSLLHYSLFFLCLCPRS